MTCQEALKETNKVKRMFYFIKRALRCIASQQAKTGRAGSSCARISTPPREARVGDPGPAAQGNIFSCALRHDFAAHEWNFKSAAPPGLIHSCDG